MNVRFRGGKPVLLRMRDALLRRLAGVSDQLAMPVRPGAIGNSAGDAENLTNIIIDAAPSALLLVGRNGVIARASSVAERLFGYGKKELNGKAIDDLIPQRFRANHKGMMNGFMEKPSTRVMGPGRELFGLRKDGSEVPIEVGLNALEIGSSTPILASIVDISGRKRAQHEAAKANALSEAIINSAPFSIIATDSDGTIVAANPGAENMLWYRESELIGRASPMLIHDLSEVEARAEELKRELGEPVAADFSVFISKASRGQIDGREWTYVRKDGSRFPVHLTVSSLLDEEGENAGYLGIAYDITDRKRADEYIRHIAHHDTLTGLPNRVLMYDRLDVAIARANRFGTKVGVLLIDLDHFKRVNDTLGHHVGDQFLVNVTQIIQRCLRATDTLARMGGDEFVVLMPDITSETEASDTARQIVAALTGPVHFGKHLAGVTTSIGLVLYPDHGLDGNTLLMHADMAMYEAKRCGRSQYQVFSREMAQSIEQQLDLERAVAGAIEYREFFIEYQPEISITTGQVVAVEALLRWEHPKRGLIPPDQFIPIVEENGMIIPIGEWVLRTACAEIGALNKQLHTPIRLSVNVSPRQLINERISVVIEEVLRENDIPPYLFEIEVTEVALMNNGGRELEILTLLRDLGITISIDDFGTGYSSLSYLAQFSIDQIKIDKSFVQDLVLNTNRETIVSAIIAMAHKLNIGIIAEGVETGVQLDWLIRQGCTDFQGYLFARPVGVEKLQDHVLRLKHDIPRIVGAARSNNTSA